MVNEDTPAVRRYSTPVLSESEKLRTEIARFSEDYVMRSAAEITKVNNGFPNGEAWFVTLTTRYELTLKSSRRAIGRFTDYLRSKGRSLHAVWFAEKFEVKEGYHLHALVASDAPREELKEAWSTISKCAARSDFRKYKVGKRGGEYASKYISKKGTTTDYDFI